MANDWIDYWNRSDSMQDKVWRKDAIWTAKQICKELKFNKETDVLLEIGCGCGFIIESLSLALSRLMASTLPI
jgi:16S rRNA A1518/A1519 N6-dimethyltransferase RsmA/KsgA/DIM1 with predicted DNA glycosylase/AP lyase activity